MKTSKLRSVFEKAKMGANIELTFPHHVRDMHAMMEAQRAGDMILHFADTGKIAIVKSKSVNSKITFAKTPLFEPQDGKELAHQISSAIITAVARDIPDYRIVLEMGKEGWQLKFTGGNKLLRTFFKAICEMSQKFLDFKSTVLYDKNAVATLNLSKGSDDAVMQFAEIAAGMFKTQLVF